MPSILAIHLWMTMAKGLSIWTTTTKDLWYEIEESSSTQSELYLRLHLKTWGSTEAEYRALADTTCELVWLRWLLAEMDALQPTATPLYCDNHSAIYIAHQAHWDRLPHHSPASQERQSQVVLHLLCWPACWYIHQDSSAWSFSRSYIQTPVGFLLTTSSLKGNVSV